MKVSTIAVWVALTVLQAPLACRSNGPGRNPSADGASLPSAPPIHRPTPPQRLPQTTQLANRAWRVQPFAVPPSGEGMWPWADLQRLNEKALRERGLRLPLGQLWTPGKGGLARAVVGLGHCSASFISPDGLFITNHHCAYRAIQRNSTPENNLLADGFVARSRDDERNAYGMRVFVFQNQRDVTAEITRDTGRGLPDEALALLFEKREKELVAKCEKRPNRRCAVSRENDGLRFLLLENVEIRDVRLVAAPPNALGQFGGEIDNFRWPRHTLDFSLLRAYVSPKGEPRAYSKSNVPYRPQRFLRVSSKGARSGDFTMLLGTPGETNRYATSEKVKLLQSWLYPTRVRLYSDILRILRDVARRVPASKLKTASAVRYLDNKLTNAKGMIVGLKRRRVLERKLRQETAYRAWVAASPERRRRWGGALDKLIAYEKTFTDIRDRELLLSVLDRSAGLLGFAVDLARWAREQRRPDRERLRGFQERDRARLRQALTYDQRSYHPAADKAVFAYLLSEFGKLPKTQRPSALERALRGNYGRASIQRFLDGLYSRTRLGTTKVRLELFGKSWRELAANADPALRLGMAMVPALEARDKRRRARIGARFRLRRPYLSSLIRFRGKRFYPDANRSPRVTFAHVAGYSPRDGVWHLPFTTVDGLLAKDRGADPFDLPRRVASAVKSRRFGAHVAPRLGTVPACFLTNSDTTGGNSGSPVLNGRGDLIGINFDRVYENIAGDFQYSRARSRNIVVDIRWVLWYLEQVAGGQHILREIQRR